MSPTSATLPALAGNGRKWQETHIVHYTNKGFLSQFCNVHILRHRKHAQTCAHLTRQEFRRNIHHCCPSFAYRSLFLRWTAVVVCVGQRKTSGHYHVHADLCARVRDLAPRSIRTTSRANTYVLLLLEPNPLRRGDTHSPRRARAVARRLCTSLQVQSTDVFSSPPPRVFPHI